MRPARVSSVVPAVGVDSAVDVVRAAEEATAKAAADADLDANLAGSPRVTFEF